MQRTQKHLASLIESGDLYEAQQVYKATYRRLLQRKQYETAKSFLEEGIKTMITKKQYTQANELLSILITLFVEVPEVAELDFLINLFQLYPSDFNISNPLKEAIEWNEKFRESKENIKCAHPSLYLMHGTRYWLAGDFGSSLKAFLKAQSSDDFVDMLSDWTTKANPSECDLICVRAVLLLLTHGNLKEANEVFDGFCNRFYKTAESRTPLINFTQFLLITLERDAYPFFQTLTEKYKPSINRDGVLSTYLDKIASVFFKVNTNQQNNFLGDMLKSFLGGQ